MGHLKGISHVAYNVRNFEASIDFYCNVLGFEKAFEIVIDEGVKEFAPDQRSLGWREC